MEKFREYTKEIAEHLDSKYKDVIDNIFANDVANDLSMGYNPADVYIRRCRGINSYHGTIEQSRDIFRYVYNYMKK